MTLKRDAIATIINRNQFYQDGYRLLLKVALVQGILVAILVSSLIAIFVLDKPEYRFFATTADGRIIDIVPLDVPYRGDVVAWSSQAAVEAMTFGFSDYRMRLQNSARFFTQRGWQTFLDALNTSRILETIDKRQLNLRGNPRGAAQIKRQGVVNGVYQWVLEMPYDIEYLGPQGMGIPQPTVGRLTLVVQRIPTLENPEGIGIDQWILVANK